MVAWYGPGMKLTVGELRARIEGLPDETPVSFDVEQTNGTFVPGVFLRGVFPGIGPGNALVFFLDANHKGGL